MAEWFNNEKKSTLLSVFLFLIAAGVLLWKVPYGWGAYDEPFYVSTPYRFIMGADGFLTDEWNMAQLSFFFLIIPIKIFSLIRPDMEGAVLFFRIIFSVVHIFVSVLIFFLLKKRGSVAVIAAICYILFIPFNIINFSYDAVGLTCITLIALMTYEIKEPSVGQLFFTGILFAAAVLCNPYLSIIILVYFIVTLLLSVKKLKIHYINLRDFIWILSGICFPAIIFLLFNFSRTTMTDIINNLPYILNDPTHGKTDFAKKLTETLKEVNSLYFPWIYLWICLIICQIFDKAKEKRREVYIISSASVFLLSIAKFAFNVRVNCYMMPFALLGINMFLISEKKDKRTLILWLTGPIYGIFMWMASDQGIYIVSMAMLISVIATVLMVRDVYDGNKESKWKYVLLCIISMQIFMEVIGLTRYNHWESVRTEQLDTVYERGPLKGLRSTKDKVDTYYLMLDDIEDFRDGSGKRIAFMTLNTWEYLYTGRPYGTFSAWLGYTDGFIGEKFLNWCRIHPDKCPDCIYFSKLEDSAFTKDDIDRISRELGYDITDSNISIKLTRRK